MWMSTGVAAMNTPESPPMVNIATNPMALSMGTWKRRFPRHMVPIQLNTLIADGTAMIMVVTMKVEPRVGFIPETNMWWPHTIHPRNAIPVMAKTIEW